MKSMLVIILLLCSGSLFAKQFRLMFRESKSSTGQDKMEQEANAFAAALLMPKELLIN